MNKVDWCINRHKETNHFYDVYLPYEFHLRMVYNVFSDFKYLLEFDRELLEACELACWGHDLIEDTRTSFNDCVNNLGQVPAEIIYAVTNEKGKNRAQRANDKYYDGIRNTRGATFIKLCDRIANVQYSKLTKSRMFEMYKKENTSFTSQLGSHIYMDMVDYLDNLFND